MKRNHSIIATGSVDGVCTAAAVMRNLNLSGNASSISLWFAQSLSVDRINHGRLLKPNCLITFVDLPINDANEEMALKFVQDLIGAGHEIRAVVDVHNEEAWKNIFHKTALDFESLVIKPITGKDSDLNSSGSLFLSSLKVPVDSQVLELCKAADLASKMDYSSKFAGIVKNATRCKITDDARRKYLVYHLAEGNATADDIIAEWIGECDGLLSTHEKLKKDVVCITKGVVMIDASGEIIDLSVLLSDLYTMGARVAVVRNDIFNKDRGYKFPKVTIATCDNSLDVLTLIKRKIPEASGFASRVHLDPEQEEEALEAVIEGMVAL